MIETMNKVLVHGANGVQGGAIARQLRAHGFAVRAGVRDVARGEALRDAGIEVVAADLEDRSALALASQGVDAVVLTLPLDWNRETVLRWTENAVRAARQSGVGLLVMNSSTRIPEQPSDVPTFEQRREAEALVRELGPRSIVLRPPFFMENLLSPWIAGPMMNEGVVAYPVPDRMRVEWLSVEDLGAYVVAALRRPDLAGRTFDVAGPEALDGPALAGKLSLALGRPLRYGAIPPELFAQGLAGQFGPTVARGIARGYFWIAAHADSSLFVGSSGELRQALPRPPMSVTSWARKRTWA